MAFPSGARTIDALLDGGYPSGLVSVIYGPAASGKTTACMLAAIAFTRAGKKVVYIDTEGGFSTERFKQLAPDYGKLLQSIIFLKIKSFDEQIRQFKQLPELAKNPRIGLIIVDTIGSHYRSARREETYRQSNNELAMQVEILQELAKREDLLVLMTNQVYADVEKVDEIVPVGGEIIRKRCGCMVELKPLSGSMRSATLVAHPQISEKKEAMFEIVQDGFLGK
jgi:DNA repair protein RadB